MSRDQEALVDIVEAIKLILRYVEKVNLETLAVNIEKQDAILRRIAIIAKRPKDSQKILGNNIPPFPGKKLLECVMSLLMIMMKSILMKSGQSSTKTCLTY